MPDPRTYRLLRTTHLWLGLGSFLFLFAYAASAVQMAHPKWFERPRPQPEVVRVPLSADEAREPRRAAHALMDGGHVRGTLTGVDTTPGGFSLRVARPGASAKVEVDTASRMATVSTTRSSFVFVLNRLHHATGMHHDFAPLDAWGALVLAVAFALLAIAATGIYLWWKLHKERRVGLVLLALGLAYALPLALAIRMAG